MPTEKILTPLSLMLFASAIVLALSSVEVLSPAPSITGISFT
jgi:hypothetical protein